MYFTFIIILVASGFILEAGSALTKCPNGAQVFANGLTEANKLEAVTIHNKYRLDIANGRVPNQPRGTNLKRMSWDNQLASTAFKVSETCKMEHVQVADNRFPSSWTGQNLYISWSSAPSTNQNWTAAVTSWFDEYKNFRYPSTSTNGKATGHYTQLVWAISNLIGCDFVSFYDYNQPTYPYAKLYSCNYGPGGNWAGEAPYQTGNFGCETLC